MITVDYHDITLGVVIKFELSPDNPLIISAYIIPNQIPHAGEFTLTFAHLHTIPTTIRATKCTFQTYNTPWQWKCVPGAFVLYLYSCVKIFGAISGCAVEFICTACLTRYVAGCGFSLSVAFDKFGYALRLKFIKSVQQGHISVWHLQSPKCR